MLRSLPDEAEVDVPQALRLVGDVVLLDIEGTISPISFVRDVLFAYSRTHLREFLAEHHDDPVVSDILAQASEYSGLDAVAALEGWQDRDEKAPPLKKIQGLIWEAGYRSGAFQSSLFPDALAVLPQWKARGLQLYVYSSGSIEAQTQFFSHTTAGDLRSLFSGHYDTDIGPKIEAASYTRIAEGIGSLPSRIVFFSDNPNELEAARRAGLQVVHVIKEDTPPTAGFPQISKFNQVDIARFS